MPTTPPDPQLLLLDADSVPDLRGALRGLADRAPQPPADLAAVLRGRLADRPVRAAVLAATPDEARDRLAGLAAALPEHLTAHLDVAGGVFAGRPAGTAPPIGYLFPGQGAGVRRGPGALARFDPAAGGRTPGPAAGGTRVVASSLSGLRVLTRLGVEAATAAGHSLGELTALHWAGALSEPALLGLVAEHGRILDRAGDGGGTMARIGARPAEVEPLLRGGPVVVAGTNTPTQTVVSGPRDAVARVRAAAAAAGLDEEGIPVTEAFHSPAMAPAAEALRAHLAGVRFGPVERSVLSTVTGDVLPPVTDLRGLLVRQVCAPVRFSEAVARMGEEVRLIVEVGPDQLLSRLAARICPEVAVVPLVTDGPSPYGLLSTVAAAYALGAPVRPDLLAAGPAA